MATITGDHVGYPGFQDLGNFSPRRKKNFGERKFAMSFTVEFSRLPFDFTTVVYNLFSAIHTITVCCLYMVGANLSFLIKLN
jgi:hypothetical protein